MKIVRGSPPPPKKDKHGLRELLEQILALVRKLKPCACHSAVRGRLGFNVGTAKPKTKGATMLEVSLTNEQKIHIGVNPVTATGKPAKIDGAVSATVQTGSATVVIDEDGKGFTIVSADDPGDSEIVVSADADLGEGVETISDIVLAHVAGANAVNLGLSAGAPEPK